MLDGVMENEEEEDMAAAMHYPDQWRQVSGDSVLHAGVVCLPSPVPLTSPAPFFGESGPTPEMIQSSVAGVVDKRDADEHSSPTPSLEQRSEGEAQSLADPLAAAMPTQPLPAVIGESSARPVEQDMPLEGPAAEALPPLAAAPLMNAHGPVKSETLHPVPTTVSLPAANLLPSVDPTASDGPDAPNAEDLESRSQHPAAQVSEQLESYRGGGGDEASPAEPHDHAPIELCQDQGHGAHDSLPLGDYPLEWVARLEDEGRGYAGGSGPPSSAGDVDSWAQAQEMVDQAAGHLRGSMNEQEIVHVLGHGWEDAVRSRFSTKDSRDSWDENTSRGSLKFDDTRIARNLLEEERRRVAYLEHLFQADKQKLEKQLAKQALAAQEKDMLLSQLSTALKETRNELKELRALSQKLCGKAMVSPKSAVQYGKGTSSILSYQKHALAQTREASLPQLHRRRPNSTAGMSQSQPNLSASASSLPGRRLGKGYWHNRSYLKDQFLRSTPAGSTADRTNRAPMGVGAVTASHLMDPGMSNWSTQPPRSHVYHAQRIQTPPGVF